MNKFVYIPAAHAEPLSQALWGLSRPHDVRGEHDTKYLFPWVTALNGSLWLVVDTEYQIPVHAEAELNGIAEVLQPFIDAGQLPANTNDELAALVESKRGQMLVVYEAFPTSFKLQAKTQQEMIDVGLLTSTKL